MIVARSGYLRHDYLNLKSSEVVVGSHQFDLISVFFVDFFFIFYGAPGDSDLSSGCSWLYRHLRITSKLWALKKNNWLLCVFFIIIAHAVVSV